MATKKKQVKKPASKGPVKKHVAKAKKQAPVKHTAPPVEPAAHIEHVEPIKVEAAPIVAVCRYCGAPAPVPAPGKPYVPKCAAHTGPDGGEPVYNAKGKRLA